MLIGCKATIRISEYITRIESCFTRCVRPDGAQLVLVLVQFWTKFRDFYINFL